MYVIGRGQALFNNLSYVQYTLSIFQTLENLKVASVVKYFRKIVKEQLEQTRSQSGLSRQLGSVSKVQSEVGTTCEIDQWHLQVTIREHILMLVSLFVNPTHLDDHLVERDGKWREVLSCLLLQV